MTVSILLDICAIFAHYSKFFEWPHLRDDCFPALSLTPEGSALLPDVESALSRLEAAKAKSGPAGVPPAQPLP